MTMNREDWLKRRKRGIGASEAAAVLGLHPYHSPMSLFYEKTAGQPVDEEDTEVQEWGLLLEPAISAKYEKVTGRHVITPEPFVVVEHPSKPFILATPDRYIESPLGVLELKTSAFFKAEEELPLHWQIQVQAQLLVTGMLLGSVAVLVAGRKFYHADIQRNEAFVQLLMERLEEFWDHVQRGIPPNPDGHAATTEALKKMYPNESGGVLKLPAVATTWVEELPQIKDQIKQLEARESELQNYIRASMGENTWGVLEDGSGYSLKTAKRGAYSVEATEYRQLRRVNKIPRGLTA